MSHKVQDKPVIETTLLKQISNVYIKRLILAKLCSKIY